MSNDAKYLYQANTYDKIYQYLLCGDSNPADICISNSFKECFAGDVYWYDSCNVKGGLYESCSGTEVCENGICINPPVDCVGSWSDTSVCSETCGDGVLEQVYSISVPAAYGGDSCPYVDGAIRLGTTSCNLGSCCDSAMGNSCSIDQCTSGTIDCGGVCTFSSYLAYGTDVGTCSICDGSGGITAPADDSACGTIDCDGRDGYEISGTNSAFTTTNCIYKNYVDLTSNRCEGVNNCKDANTADCNVYTSTTQAIAGICEKISGCSGSTSGTIIVAPDETKLVYCSDPGIGYLEGGHGEFKCEGGQVYSRVVGHNDFVGSSCDSGWVLGNMATCSADRLSMTATVTSSYIDVLGESPDGVCALLY